MTDFEKGSNPFGDEDLLRLLSEPMEQIRQMIVPRMAERIREVLERNHALVDQDPHALDFLTAELVEVVLPRLVDLPES